MSKGRLLINGKFVGEVAIVSIDYTPTTDELERLRVGPVTFECTNFKMSEDAKRAFWDTDGETCKHKFEHLPKLDLYECAKCGERR